REHIEISRERPDRSGPALSDIRDHASSGCACADIASHATTAKTPASVSPHVTSAGFDARSSTDPSSILSLTKQLGIGAESAHEFATARQSGECSGCYG